MEQVERKDKKMPAILTAEAKQHLVLEEIAKGTTYMGMVRKFMSDWNLSKPTVMAIIGDAIDYMKDESTKENLIAVNMQRLDSIIADSIQNKDRKTAIRGIDVQNKLAGGYEEKVKITNDSDITFKFDIGE